MIMRSMHEGRMSSRLTTTVKTHKGAGEVSHRNIHSSAGYAFAGLSKWVGLQLREQLGRPTHLLRDARHLVTILKQETVANNSYFIKIDVKDFYMSGTAQELTEDARQCMHSGPRKKLLESALLFLLQEQYVESPLLEERTFKVVLGSGMGLPHSGELADLVLLNCMERNFTCARKKRVDVGIQQYWRFRDDILIVGSNPTGSRQFFNSMKARAKYFALKVESVSRTDIRYLQLTIGIDRKAHKFWCAPTYKESSLGMPLSHRSCQPMHVHMSWPAAQISGLGGLTTTAEGAEHAKSTFIEKFVSHYSSPAIVDIIRRTDPYKGSKTEKKNKDQDGGMSKLWLVCGYHPSWRRAITSAVKDFEAQTWWQALWGEAFGSLYRKARIQVSWKNVLPNLAQRIGRLNMKCNGME